MSEGKLKNYLNVLKNEEQQFLNFLRAKYPVFHKSNFFYRDLQFGIRKFFEIKGIDISYGDSEKLTDRFAEYLQQKGIFISVSNQVWAVNYPEFVTTVPGDPL